MFTTVSAGLQPAAQHPVSKLDRHQHVYNGLSSGQRSGSARHLSAGPPTAAWSGMDYVHGAGSCCLYLLDPCFMGSSTVKHDFVP